LAFDYLKVNKGKKIKIFSCSGGITVYRISVFHKADYDYSDIFGIEDLIESLSKLKSEKVKSLIVLDSMVNLLNGS
jgi:hypothetical protein